MAFGLQEGKRGRQYGWEARNKEMLHVFNTKFGKNIENRLLGRRGENADSALTESTWGHLLGLGALGREELHIKQLKI